MERSEMIRQINDIFIDVLDDEDIKLNESTQAADVDEWDSLNHIQLVVAVEKHFKIRFSSKEIQSWNNVGEMMDCIAAKTT